MLFDDRILSLLPAKSQAKVSRFDADRDAAHAAASAASRRLQEAWQEHGLISARAREQMENFRGYKIFPQGHAFPRETDEEAKADSDNRLMQPVHAAERRRQLARDAHDRSVEVWSRYAFLEEAHGWLDRTTASGVRLRHLAPAAPRSKKILADIERVRAEITDLDAQWHATDAAPAPAADLKARAIAAIDEMAERGAPSVSATSRGGDPASINNNLQIGLMPSGHGAELYPLLVGNPGFFLFWLVRETAVEKISLLIDSLPTDGALTDDDRDASLSEISTRRLELERTEEALIVLAEAGGQQVPRRREADPRAILEVQEADA